VYRLNPQFTLSDNSLTVEVYGGYGEIGGNCLLIRDRDRKIVIDNGIRFNALKKYYRGKIQPIGINELRSVGVIPPLSVFNGIDAVYISHFHLDHLGLLGSLPHGTKVYVPSQTILETVEDWYRRSPTWLAELPHSIYVEVAEPEPYKTDDFGVTPVPVSHSSYPSYSFIYEGYSRAVFYSGDLRVNGPLSPRISTVRNLEEAVASRNIDIAFLEGTNIGSIETPLGPDEFRSMFSRLLMGPGLVMVSVDPLDFELLTSISEMAFLSNRKVVIASPRLIDVITHWIKAFRIEESNITVAVEVEKPAPLSVDSVSLKEEVLKNPNIFLLIQEPVGFLEMLRQLKLWSDELPRNATAVLTTPEPLEAESEVEEKVLASWLYSMGIQVYRLRVSGHYYPHELGDILKVLKPKRLVPIHTKHPRLMHLFSKSMLEH